MKLARVITTIVALAILAALPKPSGADNHGKKDIVETAVQAGDFQNLAAALTEAGMVSALKGKGPFTVFAPTDAAFAKLPEGTVESLLKPENREKLIDVLSYHVVDGNVTAQDVIKLKAAETLNGQRVDIAASDEGVKIDNAKVIKADIMATNGVIHVIDTVLLPTDLNIVGVASGAGIFQTMLTAAKAAGLAEALSGKGPFTVFAPTDEAFAGLPDGTVESLLAEENKHKLAEILKYHVVEGRVFSDAILKSKSVGTLQGGALEVSLDGGKAMVNDATILATDIDASNGVIHVISRVLLPSENKSAAASGGCSH